MSSWQPMCDILDLKNNPEKFISEVRRLRNYIHSDPGCLIVTNFLNLLSDYTQLALEKDGRLIEGKLIEFSSVRAHRINNVIALIKAAEQKFANTAANLHDAETL